MPTIETPRSLARDGGWKRHLTLDTDQLDGRYRNFQINAGGSSHTYNLPFAMLSDGRPILPLGTRILVFNDSNISHDVAVNASPGGGAFVSHTLPAHTTSHFLLIGYHAFRAGIWMKVGTDFVSAAGPTSPDGFRIEIELPEPRNNVNLLQEAIALGYDGSLPAMVLVHVTEFAHLGSESNLFPALSTGGDSAIGGINWFAGSTVYLRNEGIIQGMGGNAGSGGAGGTGSASGAFQAGGAGGMALRAAINLYITNLGKILGGCGGGGGGDGSLSIVGVNGGGGGGGAGARALGNQALIGGAGGSPGQPTAGTNGTTTQGGTQGLGSQVTAPGPVVTVGGHGGVGGSYAATTYTPGNGDTANVVNNGSNNALGTGGLAGAAISRKPTATVTIVPGSPGIIGGATIVV
jgi:hypothetical protein